MHAIMKRLNRALLALLVALGGLSLAGSPALAANISIQLCAKAGTATMPGAVSVPIWGYALGACGAPPARLPGPVLEVNVGDVVTITVTSDASLGSHIAGFELAGLPVTPLGGGQYTFTASRAGTFSYGSPGDSGRQMAMGLYGALVVRPAAEPAGFATANCSNAAGSAYGNAFNRECVLVLSQLDPNFNANPDTFDMNNYLATYWMINGKAYPDTTPIAAPAGTRLLLRYVNGGYDNTTMMVLGMHEQVLARDAYALTNPFLADAETVPAGGTEDAIATIPAGSPPTTNGYALYNRQLHVTNGTASSPNYAPGGMMTFIQP